jgi:hypothetical protein
MFVLVSGLPKIAPKHNAMGKYEKLGPMHFIRRVSYGLQFILQKHNDTWGIGIDSFGGQRGYKFLEVTDKAESPSEITGKWVYVHTKNSKGIQPRLVITCDNVVTPTPPPTSDIGLLWTTWVSIVSRVKYVISA